MRQRHMRVGTYRANQVPASLAPGQALRRASRLIAEPNQSQAETAHAVSPLLAITPPGMLFVPGENTSVCEADEEPIDFPRDGLVSSFP